jgi:hypothetical protein
VSVTIWELMRRLRACRSLRIAPAVRRALLRDLRGELISCVRERGAAEDLLSRAFGPDRYRNPSLCGGRAGKGDLQTFLNEKLDQVGKKITDAILKLVPTEMIYSKGAEASTTLVSAAAASGGSPVALASNMLYQYLFGR